MRALLLAAVLGALAFPAGAEHCTTYSTTTARLLVHAAGSEYFVDDDGSLGCPECPLGLWVYEESNGLIGLQRGDDAVDDTCHGMVAPDTVVF